MKIIGKEYEIMVNNNLQDINSDVDDEDYIPNKKIKRFDVLKKIKTARLLLFWAPIVQIASSIVFLILLIVDAFVGEKMGFEFNKLELALALSYVGCAILISVLCFMVPAKKLRKKTSFRIIAITTLILSTLILSGSFVFWAIPVLLFYSLVTLLVWIAEVMAAIMLIFVVEELPNQK